MVSKLTRRADIAVERGAADLELGVQVGDVGVAVGTFARIDPTLSG